MKVAVIPARGGSKRIPRKNIKDFLGKPIIAYSIEAATQSGIFDMVVVSTDDEEIVEVARQWGGDVPFLRPKEIADDYTGTNDVVKHAISWISENIGEVECACCIYATAPFVKAEFLSEAHSILVENKKSYVFSVTSFPFPIQRALRINHSGDVEAIWPKNIFKRSQDLEESYHDAGQFYWGTAKAFLNDEVLFSNVSMPFVLPRHLVQDIDTPEDWVRAELMYKCNEYG